MQLPPRDRDAVVGGLKHCQHVNAGAREAPHRDEEEQGQQQPDDQGGFLRLAAAFADLPLLEKKVQEILASKTPDQEPFTVEEYLTKYTNDTARAAVQKYLELGDKFWMLIAMSL